MQQQPPTATPMVGAQSSFVAFGVPINDPQAGPLTIKVLRVAGAIAALSVLSGIFSVVECMHTVDAANAANAAAAGSSGIKVTVSPLWCIVPIALGVLLSMLVPLCGYKGAKEKDRNCLCWFWGCNLAGALFGAYGLVSVASALANGFFAVYFQVFFSVVATILQALAAYWGHQLYSLPYFVVVQTQAAAAPVATVVAEAQPVMAQPVMAQPFVAAKV